MKKIFLFFFLLVGILAFAQQNPNNKPAQQPTYSQTEIDLKLQLQERDLQLVLQQQKLELEGLQKEFSKQKEELNASIDRQDKYVHVAEQNLSSWIAGFGIWIGFLTIVFSILSWLLNKNSRKYLKESEAELEKTKLLKQEIEAITEKAQGHLCDIEKNKNESDELVKNMYHTLPENQSPERKKEIAEAAKKLDQTKPEAELTAEEWFIKGYNAHVEKKYKEAINYYQKSTELNPNNASAYNNWGVSLFDLFMLTKEEKLLEDCIEKYQQAISLDSNFELAKNNMNEAIFKIDELRAQNASQQQS